VMLLAKAADGAAINKIPITNAAKPDLRICQPFLRLEVILSPLYNSDHAYL